MGFEVNDDVERKVLAIMKILGDSQEPLGARVIAHHLKEHGVELSERAEILDRKLELISRTVSTTLDLLQTQRGLRVEWYILALIVFEICLSLYDIFTRTH